MHEAEKRADGNQSNGTVSSKRSSVASVTLDIISDVPKSLHTIDIQKDKHLGTQVRQVFNVEGLYLKHMFYGLGDNVSL